MREGILRLGRQQLHTRGAADLSVREIARGLGVASSALYRHVRNRDELLTLLVVDAFTDLAETVDNAVESTADTASQLHALAHCVHQWALDNPARWALIYGTPVLGYAAPADDTNQPGTRVMAVFLRIIATGVSEAPDPSPALAKVLRDGAEELGVTASSATMAEAVGAWTAFIGAVSADIFTQLGPDFRDHGTELIDRWVHRTRTQFAL